jgi:BlaI family transcriptional regulator, penicillinase repressor
MKRKPASNSASSDALTPAEWEVMKVVWRRQPCSAGDVQEDLASTVGWAYSTVKTTMDRMLAKGFLSLTKVRHVQLFQARLSRAEAAAGDVRRLLNRAFDGAVAPMVNHLLEHESLSADDLAELRRMIDQAAGDDPKA